MPTVPTIADVERMIGERLSTDGHRAADPFKIVDILLCYCEQDGFDLYAVVGGASGGMSIPLGGELPPVTVVNRLAGPTEALMAAWIGETVRAGSDVILLAGRAADTTPTTASCREALLRSDETARQRQMLRSALRELSVLLRSAEQRISDGLMRYVQFEELTGAVVETGAQLDTLRDLWLRLDCLAELPSARRVDNLGAAIARESEALHKLRDDVANAMADIDERAREFAAVYELLADRRNSDAAWRESERQRINAEYRDALYDPDPIDIVQARNALEAAHRSLALGDVDSDTVTKRLITLRRRCVKSIEIDQEEATFGPLIAEIDSLRGSHPQESKPHCDAPTQSSAPRGNQLSLEI